MPQRRRDESVEEFRLREAEYRRALYWRQKASGVRPAQLIRSERARRDAGSQRNVERSTEGPCSLGGCSDPILAKRLCYRHYRAAQRAAGVAWALTTAGRKGHKGRAKRFGVPYEFIDSRKVFERDGWICGICSGPVDRMLRSPDPLSASLDHIVPMSKGGGHVYSNTQCSHLGCNIRKAARIVPSAEGAGGAGRVDSAEQVA